MPTLYTLSIPIGFMIVLSIFMVLNAYWCELFPKYYETVKGSYLIVRRTTNRSALERRGPEITDVKNGCFRGYVVFDNEGIFKNIHTIDTHTAFWDLKNFRRISKRDVMNKIAKGEEWKRRE